LHDAADLREVTHLRLVQGILGDEELPVRRDKDKP